MRALRFGRLPPQRRVGGRRAQAQLGKCALSAQDAALCSRIVYGVMQNELLLNWYLSAYCTQKLDHLQPPLADILRIGAYQILFLDKVPDHAAVSESVELCRTNGRSAASGLVNAVLRKVAQNKSNLPPLPKGDIARLSIAYSHPQWLVKKLVSLLGTEEAEQFLRIDNEAAPMTVQVNPIKSDADTLVRELSREGIHTAMHEWVPDCFELSGTGDLTTLAAFYQGRFTVQDAAAKLVTCAAGTAKGQRVLDVCAAPGGKSTQIGAALAGRGTLHISAQPRDIDGGFVLVYGDIEENGTLAAQLDDRRAELQDMVNRILFD